MVVDSSVLEARATELFTEEISSSAAAEEFVSSVTASVDRIDKETAISLLVNPDRPQNRSVSEKWVSQLQTEMNAGNWRTTHQGIAIDKNGNIIDGQQRLTAFIQSDLDYLEILVVRGLAPDAILAIDRGKKRDNADSWTISGTPTTRVDAQAIKSLIDRSAGSWKKTWTDSQMLDLRVKYRHALDFAVQQIHGKRTHGITTSTMRAVVLRAYTQPSVEIKRLEEFCRVMITGMPLRGEEDLAAITLRNCLLSRGSGRGGNTCRSNDHRMIEIALFNFLKMYPLKVLRPVDRELFPISEDFNVSL